jgi:molecular chaperone DnaK
LGRIAGIDLGTTYSGLAVLNELGRPETVPNLDGERITPSAVFFPEDTAETVLVGTEALNAQADDAHRAARWIKRYMGEERYPREIAGRSWTPAELSSLILRKLREECGREAGGIEDAVITVPAYFDEVRRKATMDAGKMAGLNVVAIINEPTAAALYYATEHEVSGRILVFDLGGGTFDVTVMDVRGHDIDIVCSKGDHQLGGYDFDRALLDILRKIYREETGGELAATEEDRARFMLEAETLKKTLSRRPSSRVILASEAGTARGKVTRQRFEEAVSPLMARIEMLVEDVLDEAEMEPEDLSQVLLVGGSTRIPLVSERLERMFGSPPKTAVNVDECVAMGAAIHAGLRMMQSQPSRVPESVRAGLGDIRLKEVCGHCYGTIVATLDDETGRQKLSNDVLIEKNTPLPCSVSRTYYTAAKGQTAVEAKVTQHATETDDADLVNLVAKGKLDLPPGRDPGKPVKVTYSYDENQRMHCVFEDVETARTLELDIDTQAGSMSPDEVERRRSSLRVFTVE